MARSPEERSPKAPAGEQCASGTAAPWGLEVEEIETPSPDPGEVLVRVHAGEITRGELEWPVDRLPAIPSYELSGVLVDSGDGGCALTPFDRDGVAAGEALGPARGRARARGRECASGARVGRSGAYRRPASATRRRRGRGERAGRPGLRHSWRRDTRWRARGHDRRGGAGRDLLRCRTRPRATAGVGRVGGR